MWNKVYQITGKSPVQDTSFLGFKRTEKKVKWTGKAGIRKAELLAVGEAHKVISDLPQV